MSNEILAELNNSFGKFVAQAQSQKTLYPACWKRTVLNLNLIANDKAHSKLFSANARTGFFHMNCVVCNQMCAKCSDVNSFKWLNEYINAWLKKDKLPEFGGCCIDVSYTSDNSDD
jgi:hypothetical protein